jgi:hypothetical protein
VDVLAMLEDMEPIRSDALAAVDYDEARLILTVEFAHGGIYEYAGVPRELYDELLDAQPHPWAQVGDQVKQYPYERRG